MEALHPLKCIVGEEEEDNTEEGVEDTIEGSGEEEEG